MILLNFTFIICHQTRGTYQGTYIEMKNDLKFPTYFLLNDVASDHLPLYYRLTIMLCVGFNIIIYYNKSECKLSFQNSDEKLKYQKI